MSIVSKVYWVADSSTTLASFGCHRLALPNQDTTLPFVFGAITVCHYCHVEGTGVKKYSKSDGLPNLNNSDKGSILQSFFILLAFYRIYVESPF